MKGRSVILAGLCAAVPGLACAPVPGEGRFVRISVEEAVIVWDEGARRQHFIRRAAFDTDAADFGFLVPTPSRPELAEADDELFASLVRLTSLPEERKLLEELEGVAGREKSRSAVVVLEQKVVSGFDAAVLEATDAAALDGWLKEHGYPSSAELVDWYRPYVDAKWKITAFKVAGGARTVTTKPVRMSFQTERPFFPYREPARKATAKNGGDRLLRVYFLADARFEGTLGSSEPWMGKAVWSNPITEEERLQLLKRANLPIMAGGGGRWLTRFDDRGATRSAGGEVFFARAPDQSMIGAVSEPQRRRVDWELVAAGLLVPLLVYGLWRLGKRNG